MFITDEHLETIEKYRLFNDLIDSTGIVNEMVLDKLRLNVRAIIEADKEATDLIDLCKDVLYHENMKAYGLNQLVRLYMNWQDTHQELAEKNEETE